MKGGKYREMERKWMGNWRKLEGNKEKYIKHARNEKNEQHIEHIENKKASRFGEKLFSKHKPNTIIKKKCI